MKKFISLALLVLAALAVGQTRDELLTELTKTDRVLERVGPLVERSGNAEAKNLLAEARRLQAEAWNAYHARMPRIAHARTMRARKLAVDAGVMVDVSPEQVREELHRTADLMDRVRPHVTRVEDARAAELWNMAQSEQATARQSYEARDFRRALKFTFTAREHARLVMDILGRQVNPDRVEAALRKTDNLIERVAGPVREAGNPRADELLQKAVEVQAQAWSRFRSRQLREAVKLTMSARDLAFRALELVLGPANPAAAEQALNETEELLRDWAQAIAETENAGAGSLLEQARTLQQSAREQFTAGQHRAAFGSTTRARRLLQRAIDLVQSGETAPAQQ
ncbi:hypothetical protein FJY71_00995 [candidate division WOR-3 bacterium]|nr:hypothetical protein [candidate division WOR-3 bacterium]